MPGSDRGRRIYLRGQVARTSTRVKRGDGDPAGQAEQAMANIDTALREAGASLADIVKVTVYLTDIRYREAVYRTMGRWLKGVFPVFTGRRGRAGAPRVAGRNGCHAPLSASPSLVRVLRDVVVVRLRRADGSLRLSHLLV